MFSKNMHLHNVIINMNFYQNGFIMNSLGRIIRTDGQREFCCEMKYNLRS